MNADANTDVSIAWTNIQRLLADLIALLPNLGLALIVFVLFFIFSKFLKFLVKRLTRRHRQARNLGLVLGRLCQWSMMIAGLFVALSIVAPTFQFGDLIQLLGIGGVAIGFAFRDVLQNFLAGVLILLTEPFQLEDQIAFKGFEGTVEDIQTRATTIRTYDGRRVVIPNAELFTNSVVVNTAYDNRRLEYDFGIGYSDDLEQAKHLILEAIASIEGILTDPQPDVLVMELAESTVNLRVRWWIHPPRRADALDARDQVLTAIKQTLTAHGIDLPFPTQQILFHDQTEASDGDRHQQREGWPAGAATVPPPRRISDALRYLAEQRSQPNGQDSALGKRAPQHRPEAAPRSQPSEEPPP